jgi:DNA polymerase sigma
MTNHNIGEELYSSMQRAMKRHFYSMTMQDLYDLQHKIEPALSEMYARYRALDAVNEQEEAMPL